MGIGVLVSGHRRDGTVTIVVSGDVDLATGPSVSAAIDEAVTTIGVGSVEVDLSAVEFLDSSGITVLLRGRRIADDHGVSFRVFGASGIVREVLELTGAWSHLTGASGHHRPAPG